MDGRVFLLVALLAPLGGGKDLVWKPNSNWGNPNNWASGNVPDCGESVSLRNVPENSVVYLDTDTSVGSIILPENGELLLGESVTIKLTPDTECTVSGASPPMAATVNEFVGAATDYWECAHNWMSIDGSPVEHAPCADDSAIFHTGYFSFVGANSSIYVRSLNVRGNDVQSLTDLETGEFSLKLEINPKCGDDPSLCPCPDDSKCPKKGSPTPKPQSGGNSHVAPGVVAGVLVPITITVILVLVAIAVLVVVCKCKSKSPYLKEVLVEETITEPPAAEGKGVYDNPLFSDDVKVDLSAAPDAPEDLGVLFEYKQGDQEKENKEQIPLEEVADQNKGGKKKKKVKEPKMNKYEHF